MIEAFEAQIRFGAIRLGADDGGADAGEWHASMRHAVEIEYLNDIRRVLEIRHGNAAFAERHTFDDRIGALGHDRSPMRFVR